MKRLIFFISFFLSIGTIAISAQIPPRDLNQIRTETSERNRALENPANNPFNRNLSISNNGRLLRSLPIPNSEVRKYILAAQRQTEVKVINVGGGDTLMVDDGAHKTLVRIIGIDAPDYGQVFFGESKKSLGNLLAGKKVILKYSLHNLKDDTGCLPARVFLDGKDIGLTALENGFAWRLEKDKFLFEKKDDEQNRQAEAKAKTARTGIWKDEKPQAPWEYRKKLAKDKKKAAAK